MAMIKKIYVQNFMAYENAEVEFDDSNIINLCGYNDSGKTAFSTAVEILGYNQDTRQQGKYIRDNTDGYTIGILFDDGVEIQQERIKSKGGTTKAIWRAFRHINGKTTLLYTNYKEGVIFNVEGVPDDTTFSIKNYMGMVMEETTGETLNVRRRSNRLLFIDTTGGDNYKIFNALLGAESLRQVSNKLTTRYNKQNNLLTELKTKKETLEGTLNQINVATDEEIADLDKYIHIVEDRGYQYQSLKQMVELLEKSNEEVPPEVIEIELNRYKQILKLSEIYNQAENIKIGEVIANIDIEQYVKLRYIANLKEQIQDLEREIGEEVNVVENSKTERYKEILSVKDLYKEWVASYNSYAEVQKEYIKVTETLDTLSKKQGFKICKNCGAIVT